MSTKKICIICGAALVLILALLSWNWLRDNKLPNFSKSSEIYVRPGDTPEEVISLIQDKCGIVNIKSLRRSFEAKEVSRHLKPGHYWINHSNSSVYVARMLNNGWQAPVKLTLAGNLRVKSNIAAKIANQLLIDSATVAKALSDNELLGKYGFSSKTAFSLLVPDTYDIYWTAPVEEILDKQKAALDAFWTEENIAKARKIGLSRQEVSTLASIVSAETHYEPEMPLVAGVYLNRLKLGIPLQADPTVAFCYDYKINRVLNKHLETDSPYNTYKHSGLPPGPICVPARECLQAVLDADFGAGDGPGAGKAGAGGNIYFCASPEFNGTHRFAKTLSEHNANANAYRSELNRRAAAKKKQNNG